MAPLRIRYPEYQAAWGLSFIILKSGTTKPHLILTSYMNQSFLQGIEKKCGFVARKSAQRWI
jgi:hypothetical protein